MPSTSSDDEAAAGAMGDVDEADTYRRSSKASEYDPRPSFAEGFAEGREVPVDDKTEEIIRVRNEADDEDIEERVKRATEHVERSAFMAELTALLNKYSADSLTNTPDYILSKFLIGCLGAFTVAMQEAEAHRG